MVTCLAPSVWWGSLYKAPSGLITVGWLHLDNTVGRSWREILQCFTSCYSENIKVEIKSLMPDLKLYSHTPPFIFCVWKLMSVRTYSCFYPSSLYYYNVLIYRVLSEMDLLISPSTCSYYFYSNEPHWHHQTSLDHLISIVQQYLLTLQIFNHTFNLTLLQ